MTKEKKPDRNWKEYNERLVQRGEILLATESLFGRKNLLFFGLPYRQLEGFARKLGDPISIPAQD